MKKEELRHDPIRENIVRGVQYISENTGTVLQVFAAIFIAIGGMSYYNHTKNIKMENASHLAGRAQNIFINGLLDEANVKFERVLTDYPNTSGATQSLVYLLNSAISNNDIDEIKRLLSNNNGAIDDAHVLAALYNIQGDVAFTENDFPSSIKYFQKAQNIAPRNESQVIYKLNIVSVLLAQNNYQDAILALKEIIDNSNTGFNEKNIAEELLAYAKHKMSI